MGSGNAREKLEINCYYYLMLKPVRDILFNGRLQYRAFIYSLEESSLQKIGRLYQQTHKFGLSLLPVLPVNPHVSSIFAWAHTSDPEKIHEGSLESAAFVSLMNDTIRNSNEELQYILGSRARRQGEGVIALVDERAPFIFGRTPECEDTIGFCRVEAGQVVPNTFDPMPTYRLLTRLGIFSLPKPLYQKLLLNLNKFSDNNS